MQETQETGVRFLNEEDPLEEGMATHSSILAWRILWTKEPGGGTVHGVAQSQIRLSLHAAHEGVRAQPRPGQMTYLRPSLS